MLLLIITSLVFVESDLVKPRGWWKSLSLWPSKQFLNAKTGAERRIHFKLRVKLKAKLEGV
jgi:hypothetical protein